MSPSVLKRLLDRDIVRHLSIDDFKGSNHMLYSAGSPASFFTLIVEGCVQVTIGKDGMEFQSRSFSYFGTQALLNTLEDPQAEYVPDYTIQPTMDCLVIIITQRQYVAARNATLFGMGKSSSSGGDDGDAGDAGESSEADGGPLLRTLDQDDQKKCDIFEKEWEMAETGDMESSLKSKSGLTAIARLFTKKSRSKHNTKPDRRELLTMSSSESDAESSDSGRGRGEGTQIQVSSEDCIPLMSTSSNQGASVGGSDQFRTKEGSAPVVSYHPSSPHSSCQTTQV